MNRRRLIIVMILIFIVCIIFLVNRQSLSDNMSTTQEKDKVSETEATTTQVNDLIKKETTEEYDNKEYLLTNDEGMLQTLAGTWKISERIVYPRAYSPEAMEDCDRSYLGRTIDINRSYFDGEDFRIHKPYYNFIATDSLYDFFLNPFNFGRSEELFNAYKGDIVTEWYVLEILQNRKQAPDNSMYAEGKSYDGYHLDDGPEDELEYDCDECDIYCLLVVDKDTILFDGGPLYRLKRVNK